MSNTMDGKIVGNTCPESKLKTSSEITNIKINQLPHWMMSQKYLYIDTTTNTAMEFIPISHREHKALL